jgi:hypothetical protein
VSGGHLDGTSIQVSFRHPLLPAPVTRTVGTNADSAGFDVTLPSGATADNQWPAGIWTVTVDLVRPGEAVTRTTNAAALLLAPRPVTAPAPAMTRDATTHALTVVVDVHPKVRAAQRAQLALGGDVALAEPHPATTGTLTFRFGDVADGPQWLRLTVDGVESLLVDHAVAPPAFDPAQRVTVPT